MERSAGQRLRRSDTMNHSAGETPFVSVIIPVYNEERYIEACLRAVMVQDYEWSRLEIVVVDGASEDGTRSIVERLASEDSRIRLVACPQRRQPFSMNAGIRAARGDVIVRIDGHSFVKPEHVRRCVDYLARSGAAHIGGIMRATGRSYVSHVIAAAMSSPFGVGSARFRYTDREQDLDTVPFGAYTREILERVGGFDERFLICEDSELDYRIILAGERVAVTPEITTTYFCRDSLARFSRQFFNYGKYRARILHKHGSVPTLRVLAPASLLTVLAALSLLSVVSVPARFALLGLLSVYLSGILAGAAVTARKVGWKYLPLLPVAFVTLHMSHGAGFLSSLPAFLTPRPADRMMGSLTTGTVSAPEPGPALSAV